MDLAFIKFANADGNLMEMEARRSERRGHQMGDILGVPRHWGQWSLREEEAGASLGGLGTRTLHPLSSAWLCQEHHGKKSQPMTPSSPFSQREHTLLTVTRY